MELGVAGLNAENCDQNFLAVIRIALFRKTILVTGFELRLPGSQDGAGFGASMRRMGLHAWGPFGGQRPPGDRIEREAEPSSGLRAAAVSQSKSENRGAFKNGLREDQQRFTRANSGPRNPC